MEPFVCLQQAILMSLVVVTSRTAYQAVKIIGYSHSFRVTEYKTVKLANYRPKFRNKKKESDNLKLLTRKSLRLKKVQEKKRCKVLICKTFSVFFRGVTWMRDSHGLFDYESRNISKKNYKTKYTGKIIR